ncbi:MAG: rhodanese-related sulfurtransferase [Bacteroidota bacterium]
MSDYQVLLYYIYTPIANADEYREIHHQFCVDNNLMGRIIVSEEGLNGTVSGTIADCTHYMNWLKADERFTNIDFKVENVPNHTFQKLHVRLKNEIVNSDLPVDPLKQTGIHLEPAEFKAIKDDEEVVIIDMRSNYEHSVGRFKNAISFDMENLRELPDHIQEIEHLKNKKIITYCTGGIKCEKASAYLLDQGFKNVYQLHGGIIKYGIEEGGEDFEGKCYVFDNRLAIEVNKVNPKTISECHICHIPCDRMVNCANPECNNHVAICPDCLLEMEGACKEDCKNHPRKRPYNPEGYYVKQSDNYTTEFGYKSRQKTRV